MRDPERIDTILLRLRHLWSLNPDLRLGQLLLFVGQANSSGATMTDVLNRLFNIEDTDWLAWLDNMCRNESWDREELTDIRRALLPEEKR